MDCFVMKAFLYLGLLLRVEMLDLQSRRWPRGRSAEDADEWCVVWGTGRRRAWRSTGHSERKWKWKWESGVQLLSASKNWKEEGQAFWPRPTSRAVDGILHCWSRLLWTAPNSHFPARIYWLWRSFSSCFDGICGRHNGPSVGRLLSVEQDITDVIRKEALARMKKERDIAREKASLHSLR